jgi:hypothetical protein
LKLIVFGKSEEEEREFSLPCQTSLVWGSTIEYQYDLFLIQAIIPISQSNKVQAITTMSYQKRKNYVTCNPWGIIIERFFFIIYIHSHIWIREHLCLGILSVALRNKQ